MSTHEADQGTEYIVLSAVPGEPPVAGSGTARVWRESVVNVFARSAEAAIRKAVEALPEAQRQGTFVAVPARSWKPVRVQERVERTLVIGE